MGIVMLVVVYSFSSLDPVLTPRSVYTAIYAIVVLLLSKKLNLLQFWKQRQSWPFIGFIVLGGLSLLWANTFSEAIHVWVKDLQFMVVMTLWISWVSKSERLTTYMIRAFSFSGLIIAILGCYQIYELDDINSRSLYSVTSTLAHRNLFASALLLSLPFTILQIYSKSKIWKLIAWLQTVIITSLIILLQARSSWLGLVVLFLGWGLLRFVVPKIPGILSVFKLKWIVGLSVGIVFAFGTFYFFCGKSRSKSRPPV